MKNLYILTTKGLGDFFVLANNPTEAQESLLEVLGAGKYGFSDDRIVINIKWITETLRPSLMGENTYNLSNKDARLLIVKS